LSGDYPAAKELLENVLASEPEDLEIPAQPEVVDPSSTPSKANDVPATLKIWESTDTKLAQFLASALSENNISAEVTLKGAVTTILVAPGNEAKAREIVREVTNGAPPR